MALDLTVTYSGKVAAASASYPQGEARNVTVSGDGTGTPWDEDLINDWLGYFQRLLSEASITPSGVADTVLASDYFDALEIVALASIPASSATVSGIVELATDAETITGTDTTRAVTPAGLQAKVASATAKGIVELATSAEAIAGTDTERAVTPAALAAVLADSVDVGAWQSVTLGTGWTHVSGDEVRYRLVDGGASVEIAGSATTPGTPSATVFTLAAGWRPAVLQRGRAMDFATTISFTDRVMTVDTDGTVAIVTPQDTVYFGFRFPLTV